MSESSCDTVGSSAQVPGARLPFHESDARGRQLYLASFCTKMNAPDLLPPRGFNCYKHGINSDLREALSVMEVGEHSDWPVQCEKTVRIIAKRLGVRVASRRLGRKDKVTIYRVS